MSHIVVPVYFYLYICVRIFLPLYICTCILCLYICICVFVSVYLYPCICSGVAVQLVDANAELLDTEKVGQTRALQQVA